MEMEQPQPLPHILPPCTCTTGVRRSCDTNSPEFDFWMVGNPPQPNLLSADQLFSDGFLLPLHRLNLPTDPPPPPQHTEPSAIESSPNSTTNNSNRWRHIFKKKFATRSADDNSTKEKDVTSHVREKREKKNGAAAGSGAGNVVVNAAELNINIWPFSRSRSAGNGGTRPRPAPTTRKVSSAPCSRSNSTGGGESKSRKWAHSPARAGVHLGRNSPVWQVRRGGGGGGGRSSEAFVKNVEKGGRRYGNDGDRRKIPASKARVLSLNVPLCIGYRNHLSCRHDVSSAVGGAAADGGGGSQIEVVRRSNLFNIRSLFTKKVH